MHGVMLGEQAGLESEASSLAAQTRGSSSGFSGQIAPPGDQSVGLESLWRSL